MGPDFRKLCILRPAFLRKSWRRTPPLKASANKLTHKNDGSGRNSADPFYIYSDFALIDLLLDLWAAGSVSQAFVQIVIMSVPSVASSSKSVFLCIAADVRVILSSIQIYSDVSI